MKIWSFLQLQIYNCDRHLFLNAYPINSFRQPESTVIPRQDDQTLWKYFMENPNPSNFEELANKLSLSVRQVLLETRVLVQNFDWPLEYFIFFEISG